MKVVEHRGFVIQQNEITNHFMVYKKIDEKTLQWVFHSVCDTTLTDDDLKSQIDNYIELVEAGMVEDDSIYYR